MKKNLCKHIHKRSEDKEKRFFLNEDLITNIDTVNELFRFLQEAQSLDEEQPSSMAFWNKKQIISLYRNVYTFGMYDKIIERLNGLYSKLGNVDLFTIDKKFLDNHYENLSDRREIASAGMELGNRLSKIPRQLITRNLIQRDEEGNIVQNNTRHWTKFYVSKLSELYNEYLSNSEQWLFMEGVTFRNDPERPGFFSVENNNPQEYSKFVRWFKGQTARLSDRKSFHCMLRDFYMYSKLKYCESFFYQMKHENMAELITMQEQGEIGINITDSSRFDKKTIKDEEERKNTILLSTELPGYSKPYIFHFKLDKLNRILSRPETEPLKIEPTTESHLGHTYFSHKLTEEQIQYIKNLRWQELDFIPITRDIIQYMKGSIIKKQEYDIAKSRIDMRKSRQGDSKMQKSENNERFKKRTRKNSLMEDQPFTEYLCENIESSFGLHIPETYKYSSDSKFGLMYKSDKQKLKLASIYNYMRNFFQTKFSESGKDFSDKELTDEANKMYIYMKLCGKGFWNLSYSDKRTVILEKVYKEYGVKFNSIIKAIQEGVPIEQVKDYVKKDTSPNIKSESSKIKKDFKGKKGTAKGLSDKNKKQQQAFKDEEDKSEDKKNKGNKKTTEELIKQGLIDSIATKKAQIELKKCELSLLEEELKRLEKLNKTINGDYNIGDDD